MEERRRSDRQELQAKLILKQLSGSGNREVDIEIVDVSKTGVGFVCKETLEIGNVYEGFLTIWTKEVLHVFMEAVRVDVKDGKNLYGAIFVGMNEMDAARIEVYQTVQKHI